MVPLEILVAMESAWKKEVFSGPRPVLPGGTNTSMGAKAPAFAGAATWCGVHIHVCVCVSACVWAGVCGCVCMCVHLSMFWCGGVCVFAFLINEMSVCSEGSVYFAGLAINISTVEQSGEEE